MKNYRLLKYIFIFMFVVLHIFSCGFANTDDEDTDNTTEDTETTNNDESDITNDSQPVFKIANWNLKSFGPTKASNTGLMNSYRDIIKDNYDIVFIQEIRDIAGEAFPSLCTLITGYSCMISSRAGTTSYKEQYGLIYKDGIEILSFEDFNTPTYDSVFERPPIEVEFKIDNYVFIAYNIHVDPDLVPSEMSSLETLILTENPTGNYLILGDLNADCAYYDNSTETQFDDLIWNIPDSADTTVSSTNCAYDRIITNRDMQNEFKEYGILTSITEEQSDHYLIWAKYETHDN